MDMYPNDPQQNRTEYPVDYLNQISAPPPKKRSMAPFGLIFLVLGGLAVLVGGLVLIAGASRPSDPTEALSARLKSTSQIADESRRNIKSSRLRSTNGTLVILLTNTSRDLSPFVSAAGFNPEKPSASVASADAADTERLKTTLEDGRLNATFDRTYSREMAFRLETIDALLVAASDRTGNDSYRAFLEETRRNLQPLKDEMATFNDDPA